MSSSMAPAARPLADSAPAQDDPGEVKDKDVPDEDEDVLWFQQNDGDHSSKTDDEDVRGDGIGANHSAGGNLEFRGSVVDKGVDAAVAPSPKSSSGNSSMVSVPLSLLEMSAEAEATRRFRREDLETMIGKEGLSSALVSAPTTSTLHAQFFLFLPAAISS